eukprot:TRINITY_DN1159_c0_g1_i1.p1 TRINITY_DN1159_c0_g1~~TRINITY_DN1159_c0_g1_i1.p1  ORF type:complete len:1290 (+),score=270.56 TRINITY_DN1159_c0_g1_i1:148-4017(+)
MANIDDHLSNVKIWGPKSLTVMIRGIRTHKKNEASYISDCLAEIKVELKEEDHNTKAQAVQKLTYLQMIGYDISWAAFNIVEVMSQPTFTNKRIGYLAASQSFHEGTEVAMLTTSLFKKAFTTTSSNQYEPGMALNCLATIVTPDLARDLAADVVAMLNSSRPYIKKKAVLVLYKVFLRFPEALRPAFPRLKDRLEDPDPSVVSAAVNVICELARKNPKNYLPLAPTLFKILQGSANNWMLIKIIKLFGALCPLERRLGKRLVSPLTNLINTTTAMSLLYECIQTCIIGLSDKVPLMRLCITKLRIFIEDPDQNLKYLGLLALYNIMKVHPKAVAEHRDLIIKCLDDPDVTIRLRALDLLTGMVTKKNLKDIVKRLVEYVDKADGYYKNDLIKKVIELCSQQGYKYITDFESYLEVLMSLTRIPGNNHGALIASQFMDVIIRVPDVRPCGIKCMVQLIRDSQLFVDSPGDIQEVLYAAVYLVGEFARYANNHYDIMAWLLQSRVTSLSAYVQSIYMQNILKIFAYVVGAVNDITPEGADDNSDDEDANVPDQAVLDKIVEVMTQRLPLFRQSTHLEVQERACFATELLNLYVEQKEKEDLVTEVATLFSQPLNPVAPGIQNRVPLPKGLDLEQQINDVPESESEEEEPKWWEQRQESESESDGDGWPSEWDHKGKKDGKKESKKDRKKGDRKDKKADKVEAAKPRRDGLDSAFYLTGDNGPSRRRDSTQDDDKSESDMPPIGNLEDLGVLDPFKKTRNSKGGRKDKRKPRPVVNMGFDMPENAELSKEELRKKALNTEVKSGIYADVDLSSPLGPDERLYVPTHRVTENKPVEAPKVEEKKSRKDRHGKRRHGRHSKKDGQESSKSREERRKERRHKSSQGKKESTQTDKPSKEADIMSGYSKGPRLLEFDTPGTPAKGSPASKSAGTASKSTTASSSSLLLGFDSPNDSAQSPAITPAVASPAKQSAAPAKDRESSRRKSSSRSGDSRKGDGEKRSAGRDGRKSSSRSGDSKKGDGERRSSRHGTKEEGSSSGNRKRRESSKSAAEAPAAAPAEVVFQKLFKSDPYLRVVYAFKASPTEPNKIEVGLLLNNASDQQLSQIKFTIPTSLNNKLLSPVVIPTLAPRQRTSTPMMLHFASLIMPQKVKGTITYTHHGSETAEKKVDFELVLPCSAFIIPTKVSLDQFAELLTKSTGSSLVGGLSLATTVIDFSSKSSDASSALRAIQTLLHVEPVEIQGSSGSYYGKSVQDHHVLVLAKSKTGNTVAVDIKCSDATLGSSLTSEINNYFRK